MASKTVDTKVKADCPNCGKNRWAMVLFNYDHWLDEFGIYELTRHRILQCPACETIIHQTVYSNSEESVRYTDVDGEEYETQRETVKQWPAVLSEGRQEPKWLPELNAVDQELYRLLTDVYLALNSNLNSFAITGLRTVFDRASELAKADPAGTFAEKLEFLADNGFVGSTEKDLLFFATDAGSAAVHRGWSPNAANMSAAFEIVEAFIYRTFILRTAAEALKLDIPKRPKRRPKRGE